MLGIFIWIRNYMQQDLSIYFQPEAWLETRPKYMYKGNK